MIDYTKTLHRYRDLVLPNWREPPPPNHAFELQLLNRDNVPSQRQYAHPSMEEIDKGEGGVDWGDDIDVADVDIETDIYRDGTIDSRKHEKRVIENSRYVLPPSRTCCI